MSTAVLLRRRLMFACHSRAAAATPLRRSYAPILQCSRFLTTASPGVRPRMRWNRKLGGALLLCGGAAALSFAVPEVRAEAPESPPQDQTEEAKMLEASLRERKDRHKKSEDAPWILRVGGGVVTVFLDYIYEPIATGVRFITLALIFTPLILGVPMVLVGGRVAERNEERWGTLQWYSLLVKSLEVAGPTFIKLGQWAASRTDIFPTELCELLSKLHSNAKAHSLHATKRIVSRAFGGREFSEIFEEFEEKPLGVGAIAQVYAAKLKEDFVPAVKPSDRDFRKKMKENMEGFVKTKPRQAPPSSWVAIKVVHPKVERMVYRDLRIMKFFSHVLNAIPTLEWFSFPDEVSTFGDMMKLQLDLRIEAQNLDRFRKNFTDRPTVTFPMPFQDFITRDVLFEEFAHAIPLRWFLESGAGPFQDDMANMGLDAFLHMLVMDNFIHSDLHPGNIMVRFYRPDRMGLFSRFMPTPTANSVDKQNHHDATSTVRSRLNPHRKDADAWTAELAALDAEGYRPQLVFIDTGLVTELNAHNRKNFLDLFRAIAEFDGYRAGHLMIERSRSPSTVLEKELFALKMQQLVLSVKRRTLALGNISFGDILSEVLQMVRNHHVRMEGDFVNVVLSMLLLEGIGRSLDPKMDLLKSSLPMLRAVGTSSGAQMVKGVEGGGGGDVMGLLKVWVALETRGLVNAAVDDVEACVKYDLLSPNI